MRGVAAAGGYDDVDAGIAAHGLRTMIGTMIDGLWLEAVPPSARFARPRAKRACLQFLASTFPRHFTGEERSRSAA